jgi:hypothetical protein
LYSYAAWVFIWKSGYLLDVQRKKLGMILALAPSMASTVIFSPVNQFTSSLSLAFAASGFLLMRNSQNRGSRVTAVIGAILCLISILTYEVTLPLIIWSFISIYFSSRNSESFRWDLKELFYKLLPLFTLVSIAILWQKLLSTIFLESNFSRLTGFSIKAFVGFFYSIFVSLPGNLIFMILTNFFEFLLIVMLLIYAFPLNQKIDKDLLTERKFQILGLVLAFSSASLLFALSSAAADLSGYLNRGLTSTWLLIILILVTAIPKTRIGSTLLIVTVASNSIWFSVKVSESNKASEARLFVVDQVLAEENSSINSTDIDKNLTLILPCKLPSGKTDIEVFCTSWDAKGALQTFGSNFKNVLVLSTDQNVALNSLSNVLTSSSSDVYIFDQNFKLIQTERNLNDLEISREFFLLSSGKEFNYNICPSVLTNFKTLVSNEKNLIKCILSPF